MPVNVLKWELKPGQPLPEPVLTDDREAFPAEVVRQAIEWLVQVHQAPETTKPPTDIIINMAAPPATAVQYKDVPFTGIQSYAFQHGQIEILFRDRQKVTLAKYHYLCARTAEGLCIVGPRLRTAQLGRIN